MSAAAPAINPCHHMRNIVHRVADGSLTGVLLQYARFHIRTCRRCQQAVEILRKTLGKLRRLREKTPEMPKERWASIEAAWMEHEQTQPPD